MTNLLFRRSHSEQHRVGMVYFISGKDKNPLTHFFNMEDTKGKWKIVDVETVVVWITTVERELEKPILENFRV